MCVAVCLLLCVIGSVWAQDRGLNNLQFRTFDPPASATQLQRSAQQFRIPTFFPNAFSPSGMPPIQNNQFGARLNGLQSFSRTGGNGLMNSNGLLMMFPSPSGRMTPGLAFNSPAPIASVLRGPPTLPMVPPNLRQFSRGSNPAGFNLGQRLGRLNRDHPSMLGAHRSNLISPRMPSVVPQMNPSTSQNRDHPSMLGAHRPNRITPRMPSVVPQMNPSTSQTRRPVTSDRATQRLIDYIMGQRAQNANQMPVQPGSQTNGIVETFKPTPSQPEVIKQTGHSSNPANFANLDTNQASSNTRYRSRTDEEIRQEVQERMRLINNFLARSPATIRPQFQNMVNNQQLPTSATRHFSNVIRGLERVDQNTLNNRVAEAFKNRDKSGKTPIVVDGGFSQDVLPVVVVDGGVSWSNQGVLFDQHQRPSAINLETNKELAKLFPLPPLSQSTTNK